MAEDTNIEWTDHTFNPWWGCAKVSPGCAHCYAETLSNRYGNDVWGTNAPRRFFGENHWNEPRKWNKAANSDRERKRVFCASMADVFENRPDLEEPRKRLFGLIKETAWLDWLLLTKRPENIVPLAEKIHKGFGKTWSFQDDLPNVWLGTSAENQKFWDERVPQLVDIPATVHFVSAEPLLGPISMNGVYPEWLIVGGESGRGARPMELQWVESLRKQSEGKTSFFFKQWGGERKKLTGRELNGRTWDELPLIS